MLRIFTEEFVAPKPEDISEAHRGYWEDPPSIIKKNVWFNLGVFSKRPGFFGAKWLTIPDKPTLCQKIFAYICLKFKCMSFIARKSHLIGHAYDCNALKIFSW